MTRAATYPHARESVIHDPQVGGGGRARPHSRVGVPGWLGPTIVAGVALFLLRTAVRVRQELADYRRSAARLRRESIAILGLTGDRSIRVHAHLANTSESAFPPVVLLPGYGMGGRYLLPLAGRLADRVHVYVPDLPGHGFSDHDVRPLSVHELAHALILWMEINQLAGAVLGGHSMGAQIAVEAALQRPDLVSGLVLIAPASDPAARTAARQLGRAAMSAAFERSSYIGWTIADFARAGARVLADELRETNSYRLESRLGRLAIPVRVLRGSRDRVIPQSWAESVARLARAPNPVVVPGWGHALPYDDPDAVAAVILPLASELVGRSMPASSRP